MGMFPKFAIIEGNQARTPVKITRNVTASILRELSFSTRTLQIITEYMMIIRPKGMKVNPMYRTKNFPLPGPYTDGS